MIINGKSLLAASPLEPMIDHKARASGVSHGLAEAGFDIRVKQTVRFVPPDPLAFFGIMAVGRGLIASDVHALEAFHGHVEVDGKRTLGRFALASSVERFRVPGNLVAVIGHKSTLARQGINVWAGTTAEPKWEGWLTLEIGFHGLEPVTIPAGSGIAQVIFHELAEPADYSGRYQGQPDQPVPAIPATEDTPL